MTPQYKVECVKCFRKLCIIGHYLKDTMSYLEKLGWNYTRGKGWKCPKCSN
jgi:hypothetical protein